MLPPLKVEQLNMNLRIKGRPVGHTSEYHESLQFFEPCHPEKPPRNIHSFHRLNKNKSGLGYPRWGISYLCLAMTIKCHVAGSASGLVIAWFISHLDLLSCTPQPVFCGLARAPKAMWEKIGSSCSTSRETWHSAC